MGGVCIVLYRGSNWGGSVYVGRQRGGGKGKWGYASGDAG